MRGVCIAGKASSHSYSQGLYACIQRVLYRGPGWVLAGRRRGRASSARRRNVNNPKDQGALTAVEADGRADKSGADNEHTSGFECLEGTPADGVGQRRLRGDRHDLAAGRRTPGRSLRLALGRKGPGCGCRQRQCHPCRGTARLSGDLHGLRARAVETR
ncbi:hypothetical protein D3C78_1223210 [compost metagenome]